MGSIVPFPNRDPLKTDDAATGRQFALEWLLDVDQIGADNACRKHGDLLAEDQNAPMMAGFLQEVLDFIPVKPKVIEG